MWKGPYAVSTRNDRRQPQPDPLRARSEVFACRPPAGSSARPPVLAPALHPRPLHDAPPTTGVRPCKSSVLFGRFHPAISPTCAISQASVGLRTWMILRYVFETQFDREIIVQLTLDSGIALLLSPRQKKVQFPKMMTRSDIVRISSGVQRSDHEPVTLLGESAFLGTHTLNFSRKRQTHLPGDRSVGRAGVARWPLLITTENGKGAGRWQTVRHVQQQ